MGSEWEVGKVISPSTPNVNNKQQTTTNKQQTTNNKQVLPAWTIVSQKAKKMGKL
jgi:hypothetical protein